MTDKMLSWELDPATTAAAKRCMRIDWPGEPIPQFPGLKHLHTASWRSHVVQPEAWNTDRVLASPEAIIEQFRGERYTQGLSLIAVWGTMSRSKPFIWGERTPETIENALGSCARSVSASGEIGEAWELLTSKEGGLGWSRVTASKTLHFLCRGLGFQMNPPVPIDTAVIQRRLWPVFKKSLEAGQPPKGWRGSSFAAYSRYMSAIHAWASELAWTTTEVEATLFAAFRPKAR